MIGIAGPAFDLSVYDIFGTLSLGAKLILPKRNRQLNIEYLVKLLDDEKVTIWNSTPAVMQMLVSYLQTHKKADLSLRKVLLSGDWIPVTLPTELYKILPNVEMISLGGATEASIWSIFYRVEKGEIFEKSIPYGKPLANQYFRVLNERLEDCPDGVTGELYIGGHGLAEGYYRSEGLTAEKFINLPQTNERLYQTGDKNGEFHSIANDVMTIGTMKSWIVKAQFSCSSSSRSYHSRHPLIPIVTEHLLLFQKENVFQIPYSFRKSGFFYLQKQDSKALTWFHLVCAVMEHLGGIVTLSQLYEELKDHPKAVNNKHYKERIRATLYEHRNEFLTNHRGSYRLSYM